MVVNFHGDNIFTDFVRFLIHEVLYIPSQITITLLLPTVETLPHQRYCHT